MLILAATTISVLFGENGIITKTKQAKSEYERAGQNEQLGLKELQNRLNEIHTGGGGGGNTAENESGGEVDPTPDMGDIQIQYAPSTPRNTSKGSAINGVERGPIQVSIQYGNTSFINHNRYQYKIGEGEWVAGAQTYQFEVNHNTTIYARYYDGVSGYKQTSQAISNVDNEGPEDFTPTLENKTTKSITIKGETNDPSGIKGYRFSKDDGSTWTEEQTGTSYTFQDLATSTYQIKIKAIDKAGNETTSQALEVATQSIPEATGNISKTETWENGKLKISLATNQASYPIQYKIDNGIWTQYSNPVELNLNQTLHYRLTDGQNAGAEASQTAQDTTKPTNPDITVTEGTKINDYYTSNITIQITQGTDNESGIGKTTYTLTGAQTQAETEIANKGSIQITQEGTTTITAYSYDKAGNKSPAGTITVKKQSNITISYDANGGTGAPGTQTGNLYNSTSIKMTLSNTEPTRSGFEFQGWSTSPTASTATYQKGTAYNFSNSTTLYAVWKSASVPTASLNLTKGSFSDVMVNKFGIDISVRHHQYQPIIIINTDHYSGVTYTNAKYVITSKKTGETRTVEATHPDGILTQISAATGDDIDLPIVIDGYVLAQGMDWYKYGSVEVKKAEYKVDITQTGNINASECKYLVTTSKELIGTTSSSWNSATALVSAEQTVYVGLPQDNVAYYFHLLTVDKTGNKIETVSAAMINSNGPTATINLTKGNYPIMPISKSGIEIRVAHHQYQPLILLTTPSYYGVTYTSAKYIITNRTTGETKTVSASHPEGSLTTISAATEDTIGTNLLIEGYVLAQGMDWYKYGSVEVKSARYQAEIVQTSDSSKINASECKYILTTSKNPIGTTSTTWNDATALTQEAQTVYIALPDNNTQYYLHLLTVDTAGNKTETISAVMTQS